MKKRLQKPIKPINVLWGEGPGGTRAALSPSFLAELEQRTKRPIADLFDMVGGVGMAGAAIAVLTLPSEKDPSKSRYTAQEVVQLFGARHIKRIFPRSVFGSLYSVFGFRSPLYPKSQLNTVLTEWMGDALLSAARVPLVIPTMMEGGQIISPKVRQITTLPVSEEVTWGLKEPPTQTYYETRALTSDRPLVFKSYESPFKGYGIESETSVLMRQVASASSSIPLVFPSTTISFTDKKDVILRLTDGSILNQPVQIIINEAQRRFGKERPIHLVTVRSGHKEEKVGPKNLFSSMVHDGLREMEKALQTETYFIFDPALPEELLPMDRVENIDALRHMAKREIQMRDVDIWALAKRLLASR